MILNKWLSPIINFDQIVAGVKEYFTYIRMWKQYSRMTGAEELLLNNAYPCLYDRTSVTQIDSHYFYQNIWAMYHIKSSGVSEHVDIGSLASFVGLLSTIVKVIFIDIRPLQVNLQSFESRAGTILNLPFDDHSVDSLSCLHVAEHIGLGRYGDPLDPYGTQKAARELSRVLARAGNLYISLPVGKPRVCFNAHRIHSSTQILEYFNELELIEFSGVNDMGQYLVNLPASALDGSSYSCGMFHFRKK
jgi:hypothetical protein